MDPIRTLIVDDEPLARENLRLRLRDIDDFVVVGECASGREAIGAITGMRPDLVFLDVRMPGLDGFAVIEELEPESMPAIVFVTAFDRYALEAFRVHALDYLLKPIEEERFAETLQTCRERVADMRQLASGSGTDRSVASETTGRDRRRSAEILFQLSGTAAHPGGAPAGVTAPPADLSRSGTPVLPSGPAAADPFLDRLVIKSGGRVFFLRIAAVDWIEAYGDYVRLHVGAQSYLLRRTMNEMETRLPTRDFARTNRSAIVNLDRVKDLEPASRGELLVRLTTGRELKLTRVYREKLELLLGDRL
jgi:two-component system, LytTR family, response regulator